MGSTRRGSALTVPLILGVLLGSLALTVWRAVRGQQLASADLRARSLALLRADNGLAQAQAHLGRQWELLAGLPAGGTVELLVQPGLRVAATHLAGAPPRDRTYALRAVVDTPPGSPVELELIVRVRLDGASPLRGPALGAVVAGGSVRLTGSVVVDGRDHAPDGSLGGAGNDRPGLVVTGTASIGGAARVGGGTQAPSTAPTEDVALDTGTAVWSEADPGNGLDDDGDGLTDEAGFPARVGGALGLPDEAVLRERARADGTFFTDPADYAAWVAAVTPQEAGGRVVWLEVSPGTDVGLLALPDNLPVDASGLPRLPPPEPSLVVVASSDPLTHDTQVGPVHLQGGNGFQGLFVADRVLRLNGSGRVVGGLLLFEADAASSSQLGNGDAEVLFSSEVLARLPGPYGPPRVEHLLWRRAR